MSLFQINPDFFVRFPASSLALLFTLFQFATRKCNLSGMGREMRRALDGVAALRERSSKVAVHGNREYNPGWHTALDLHHLLTVSEAITRAALERKESRGGHFRDDFPDKDASYAAFNIVLRKGSTGKMEIERRAIPSMPDELTAIIEEQKS